MSAKRANLILLSAVSAACLIPTTALADPSWPELFREAAIPNETSQLTSMSYDVQATQADGEEQHVLKYKINIPAEAKPSVTVNEYPAGIDESDKKELLEDLQADIDGDIWCDDHKDNVGGPVTLVSENDKEAIYTFPANPESAEDKVERKMLERSVVTITVDKARKEVSKFQYDLQKPFKPAVIAKINEFTMEGSCTSHEFGRPVLSDVTVRVAGKAMGQSFNQSTVQSFTSIQIN